MKIISLWSGPRNVSTALMYSFAQRDDTTVIDEPLYAYYLKTTQADHPGKELVLKNMENDGDKVLESIRQHAQKVPVLFLKNMCHHWLGFDNSQLELFDNIFLIRDPEQMLPSLVRQIPQPILRDTGLRQQSEMFDYLSGKGKAPIVIDSKELLLNNKVILNKLCEAVDIEFTEKMLSWESGPKPYDGVWAKFWYQNVHKSIGFTPYNEKNDPFPEQLIPLLEECRPYYEHLSKHSFKI
ncbi:sulfotransferase-like domain-containing protein [Fulvivirga lutea]|uniref:Sulfotransferase family protein n=1 Tax=Fulvivirga lutea TaxID=2810512 RepID=A0A974WI07_9BACT|nr:sulfotransferase family protein [Fulvivirga lutea]QSE98108.1 sulfotransferase family protein [Fulvivirga lutea]